MIDHRARITTVPIASTAAPCPICGQSQSCRHDLAAAYCTADRHRSKRPGWRRVGSLDERAIWENQGRAIALEPPSAEQPKSQKNSEKKIPAIDLLMAIASEAQLFRSPQGDLFADVMIDGTRITYALSGTEFRRWLIWRLDQEHTRVASRDALRQVIDVLEARAMHGSTIYPVYLRVGKWGDRLYLDLGRDDWAVVEIDGSGWRITTDPPVRFVRPPSLKPLPLPQREGDLRDLLEHLNVTPQALPLVITWAVNAISDPAADRLGAWLSGSEGAGKTTIMRRLRDLIDPATGRSPRSVPDDRDMAAHVGGRWAITIDNVSTLTADQSDALCCLSTGGGFTHRRLHTDGDEFIREFKRPWVANGLVPLMHRGDLASRTLVIECITPDELVDLPELDQRWDAAHPRLLGALLDCLSRSLAVTPMDRVNHRIGGLSAIAMAVDTALRLEPGTTRKAIEGTRQHAQDAVIDASPVAIALLELLEQRQQFTGTVGELLAALDNSADEKTKKLKSWPQSPQALRSQVIRLRSVLATQGVEQTEVGDRTKRGQIYRWSMAGDDDARAGDDHHQPSSPASSPLETPTGQAIAARGDDGDDDAPPLATAPTPATGDGLVPGATVFYIGKLERDRGQRLTLIRIDHGMASCRRADGSITTWLPIGDLQQCSATEHEHSEISDSA